jgi:hypothetical protein
LAMVAGLVYQPLGLVEMFLKPRLHLLFGHSGNVFLDQQIRVCNELHTAPTKRYVRRPPISPPISEYPE